MPSGTSSSFNDYVRALREDYIRGNFTEMTFRTALENFIESLSADFDLQQEPARTQKLGAPDYRAYRKAVKVGYVETKELTVNLDEELHSDQIRKYADSINNLILTNYTRFILIRKGDKKWDFDLLSRTDLENHKFVVPQQTIDRFQDMITTFFSYSRPTIGSPEELADELARKARLLKNLAKERLEDDVDRAQKGESASSVYDFYKGIQELVKDLQIDDCADAYAQTITYGLFLARMGSPDKLDRNTASNYVPHSIPLIKRIFLNISGDSIPSDLSWIIDDIVDVLNASDLNSVLTEIDPRSKTDRDPFMFFYENFLAQYDPKKRKQQGVFYTPRPVINYIVNSVHLLLKEDFGKLHGLADDDVTLLDPAVGTGSFLWMAYLVALRELTNAQKGGLIQQKIENHLLKDFYGFELLIPAYIFSHLKLSSWLKKWHYAFKENDRAQVYYTNTLDPVGGQGLMPFMHELTDESKIANEVKQKKRILVVVSNPPYHGLSANKSEWIEALLKKGYIRADGSKDEGYYQIDGSPLGEKNPKWLQDDYVKFLRFAQWKIDTAGEGIVGYITNHAYLDNPTFGGMRRSLMKSFNRIYILNLHGNMEQKETAPDGSKDENIFDIKKAGVAISILVKTKSGASNERKVYYADLYGLREHKYSWLDRKQATTMVWQTLGPKSPQYLFRPTNTEFEEEYKQFKSVKQIFPLHSVGIVTAKDHVTIRYTADEVWGQVNDFAKQPAESLRQHYAVGNDSDNWKVSWAKTDIIASGPKKELVRRVHFRPFDWRFTYYTGKTHGFHCRPRSEVMQNMISVPNLGLVTVRQVAEGKFNHAIVSDCIIDERLTISNKGMAYLFPLYRQTNDKKIMPNICLEVLHELPGIGSITPEELLYYAYAVLNSNKYRKRYAAFLKGDFPRIPFVKEKDLFIALSEIGKELVELHLRRVKLPTAVSYNVQGTNDVDAVKYDNGKVWINGSQYFGGISADVWSFEICGYHLLDKWLKSRLGRKLSSPETEEFMQIVEIVKKTIECMDKIDSIPFLPSK